MLVEQFHKARSNKKLKELVDIVNISDKKLEKLNYKEKQQYYRAKNKLCKVFYSGAGTYRRKENNNER